MYRRCHNGNMVPFDRRIKCISSQYFGQRYNVDEFDGSICSHSRALVHHLYMPMDNWIVPNCTYHTHVCNSVCKRESVDWQTNSYRMHGDPMISESNNNGTQTHTIRTFQTKTNGWQSSNFFLPQYIMVQLILSSFYIFRMYNTAVLLYSCGVQL